MWTDEEMVQKAIHGDHEAFEGLVRKYSKLVYGLAFSLLGDFHNAQDVAQETFVRAWGKLSQLRQGDKFSAWIVVIVRRMCMDHMRSNKGARMEIPLDSQLEIPSLLSVEEQFQSRFHQDAVWKALGQLDKKHRTTIVLNHIGGYTASEIGTICDISIVAVESRIRRAKQKLKKELADLMEQVTNIKTNQDILDEVMWRIVPRIATIEIPVKNLQVSTEWYHRILGTKVVHETPIEAMLHLQGGNHVGVPTLYLVQTGESQRLSFLNSNTAITHSVIDFFVPELARFHAFLSDLQVEVTAINLIPGLNGKGGFGFKDPDGNSFGACDVTHQGQV